MLIVEFELLNSAMLFDQYVYKFSLDNFHTSCVTFELMNIIKKYPKNLNYALNNNFVTSRENKSEPFLKLGNTVKFIDY